jgi:hypothetical protein
VRADSRLLSTDRERIVRVVDSLLDRAFAGVSGFKYERRPPHRVEGGACVPRAESQPRLWGPPLPAGASPEAALEHCRACADALIAALRELQQTRPADIQGVL